MGMTVTVKRMKRVQIMSDSNEITDSESSIAKSVAKNMSVMMGAQIVTWISGFVLLYFLPRYLGSEDFGRLYLALSIKMMMGLLIDFGGNFLIPKEVARSEKVGISILNSYIILRILLWVLAIGLVILFSNLLGYSEHVHLLILILAIGKLWEGGYSAISAYFQGIEKMEYPSLSGICERVFVSLFSVIALLLGAESTAIAVIITSGALLNLIVLVYFSRNEFKFQFQFNTKIFSLLDTGLPYFLFSLFSVIYYRIDAIMISYFTNDAVTGWYGGAFRFFDIVMVLPLIYKTAIFPVFSKLWDDKAGKLEETVSESMRLMVLLGLPVAIVIYVYASPIIDFFMGIEEYGASVIILKIFSASIPFIYLDIILGSALLGAAERQKAWALVGFFAIFVNIGMNAILIPGTQELYSNGGIGAATATLITEVFMMFSALILIPKSYLQGFKMSYLLKPLLALIVMGGVIMITQYFNIYWLLSIMIVCVFYIISLIGVKTFTKDELALLKSFIMNKKIKRLLGIVKV